ncbi:MAG: regulator of protease activity HflC (stomatin/prohibitin superfamily) [Crocinitomicaceae bacterium]|jgi:regulator of protease activity HflC (stomatin/prohibitin superfamily)
MKRVRINLGKVGIVNRRGDYDRIVTAGSHWISMGEKVVIFDMSKLYSSKIDMNIMLQDSNFVAMTEIIDVDDAEIALKYNGKNFESVFLPGRYFYFKGLMDYTFVKINLNDTESAMSIDKSVMKNTALNIYRHEFKVESSEEGLLFIDGKFVRRLTKGLYFFWKNAIPVEVLKIDMRQIQLEVSGQEILTKDKAALRVNFQANYKVVDPEKALLDNKDFEKQLYTLVQLALREFVGTLTLDELLDSKETVSDFVLKFVKTKAINLGVEVMNAGIRDIILPGEVREIMNQVLIAQKSAQANNIARREETAATRSLLNTAKLMEDNEMLFKLKEMEYIEKIADKIGEVSLSSGGQVIDQLTTIFSK